MSKTKLLLALVVLAAMALAAGAAPVDILNQPGVSVQGEETWPQFALSNLHDGNMATDFYTQGYQGVGIFADQVYDLTGYSYTDNTDDRVGTILIEQYAIDTTLPDTSTSGGPAMTGSMSGRGGVILFQADQEPGGTNPYGVGADLQILGTPTGAMRLPNPALHDATPTNWPGSYDPARALDGDLLTDYATGFISSYFMEFDFGAPTAIGFVDFIARFAATSDSFAVTFSDDDVFGDVGDITISEIAIGNYHGGVDLSQHGYPTGITKQYVRLDVSTSISPAGAQEIAFYGPIPEPAMLAILGLGGALLAARRRETNAK